MKIITYILVLFTMSGCATYQRCADKYGNTATADTIVQVRERVVPVEVMMPADTIETIIDCSHIYRHIQLLKSERGHLQSEVEASESVVRVRTSIVPMYIYDTLRMTDTITIIKEQMTLAEPPSRWHTATQVMILLFIVMTIVYIIVNKLKK